MLILGQNSCFLGPTIFEIPRPNWYRPMPKICDWTKYQNSHSSKSIRVTKLFFCQSDSPMSEPFWQKNRLVTHMFFDRCLFKHFSPVANFEQQSIRYRTGTISLKNSSLRKIFLRSSSVLCWPERVTNVDCNKEWTWDLSACLTANI